MDGSTYEFINTGTIKVTERDWMARALEAIQYILEARYNLIFMWVLDEEECQIQVQ